MHAHEAESLATCLGQCERGTGQQDAAGRCLLASKTRVKQSSPVRQSHNFTRALVHGVRPVICEAQGNTDAADILGAGEALAYGVGSAVAVADVRRMKLATVLAGGHRGAAVTAAAWCVLRHLTDSLRMFSEAHPVQTAVL